MGKGPYNRTSLRHTYQSEVPVFEIETMDLLRTTDVEILRMTNGSVVLEVGPPPAPPPGAGLPTFPTAPVPPGPVVPPFRGK